MTRAFAISHLLHLLLKWK